MKCSPGNPLYDISEVVNDAGDDNYKELLDDLDDTRKLLILYRLLHHQHSFPDLKLSIKIFQIIVLMLNINIYNIITVYYVTPHF